MSNEPLLQVEPERGGDDPRQFEINNRHRDLDLADFDRTYVSFSGFFGEHSPHLFAAAPDLLEALKEQVAECFDETCEMCTRHEAIIAKAEGRS